MKSSKVVYSTKRHPAPPPPYSASDPSATQQRPHYESPLGPNYGPPRSHFDQPPGQNYGLPPAPYFGPPSGPDYVPQPGPPQGGTVTISTVTVVPVATTVTHVTTSAQWPRLGAHPQSTICKSCNAEVVTRIKHTTTGKTHLCAAILCVCLLWPCACIPYCMSSLKKVDHYCPSCKTYLGTYRP